MDLDTYNKHINAGLLAGKDSTCGNKINYKSEGSAVKAADKMLTKKEFKANYDVVNTTDDPPKLSKMFFYEVERKKFKE